MKKIMRYCVEPIMVALLLFTHATAQDTTHMQWKKSLDELLSKEFKSHEPGVSILIAKKGNIVYEKTFGSGNLELNVPLRSEMLFNLASITKQFTAIAILQLVEQSKLSLQDSIQKYIKDYPSKGYTITIENLLTHTSGIKDYLQINFQGANVERWDFSPKELIDSFKNVPLEFEPGTKYKYGNSGYFLLGYIIEKISGKSYPQYIQENILTPLSLTHTYYDKPNAIFPNRSSGYKIENNHLEKEDFWSSTITYSAGGLISNVEDLYKWHKGLYTYKILKKENLLKAFTPFKLKDGSSINYGYGWIIQDISGLQSIEHDGRMPGYLSHEVYYPDQDIFIAALFNCGCAPKDSLSIKIAEMVLGRSLQFEVKINDAILDDCVGTYRLVSDTKRTIIISKETDHLLAKISGQNTFQVIFSSETKFQLKGVLGAFGEFIREHGKVTKFNVSQDGSFVWKKVK